MGHPADCAFGGSPEKSLNLDEGVNHIVEGLETDCPPQIAPLEIQAAPLPQGEKGLTFETKGEIIYSHRADRSFVRTRDVLLALLAHLFILHQRSDSAHSEPLRGGQS